MSMVCPVFHAADTIRGRVDVLHPCHVRLAAVHGGSGFRHLKTAGDFDDDTVDYDSVHGFASFIMHGGDACGYVPH